MDFIRYMPVVAFVPLTIIWAGTDDFQKFLIIWMGAFFQQVLLICDAIISKTADYVSSTLPAINKAAITAQTVKGDVDATNLVDATYVKNALK